MKKHDFGAWFLLCGLLFLFTPGVSAMAEEPARALDDGTLFPVLNKPFYGRRGEPR